jgi:hypothetical protein
MLKLAAAAIALSLTFAACTPMTAVETANVRVAHLSPNTPNVDVFLDGAKVPELTNVPFKTVSGYLQIPVGARKIEIFATGQTTNPAISVPSLVLEKKNYTVAAIGLLGGAGAQALKANVYVDDLVNKAGKAKVRVIHASPDAPNVDVAVQGGAVVVANLAYPNATVSSLELDAGTYPLEIRAAGSAAAVFKFSTPALAANQNYTVFAVGRLGTAGEFGVVAKNDAF